MGRAEQVLGTVVARNNVRVRRHATDRFLANPRSLEGVAWNERLEAAHPAIRVEWDAYVERGGGLPLIEDLIDEHQGNTGEWRAGLLISKGKPATALADRFPATMTALGGVPGLWSALWSVLAPGAHLPEHVGPNAGVLRYHLGVDCGTAARLRIGDATVSYLDGRGILFDDTEPHEAWNDGSLPRVTLFCELLRPIDGLARYGNSLVQRLIALDPRYRRAPERADGWGRISAELP